MNHNKNCKFVYEADHISKKIYVDTESMKRAGQIDAPEFAKLNEVITALPGYTLEAKDFPKTKKRTYGGLTIRVMQAFIIQQEETKAKAEPKLRQLKAEWLRGNLKGSGYGCAKSWFLREYGEAYKKYDLPKSKNMREKFINDQLKIVDAVYIDPKAAMEGGDA